MLITSLSKALLLSLARAALAAVAKEVAAILQEQREQSKTDSVED